MKYLLILLVTVFLCSCARPAPEGEYQVYNTVFHVTEVVKAKYSKVRGFIIYNGITIYVDNGNTGYHYKEYNLVPGQTFLSRFVIYKTPQRSGAVLISASDVVVSDYERK